MIGYQVHIAFKNGESCIKNADSNDNITAINMAVNRLTKEERAEVVRIELLEAKTA